MQVGRDMIVDRFCPYNNNIVNVLLPKTNYITVCGSFELN